MDSSDDDGDIGGGSSATKHKKRKKFAGVPAKYSTLANARGGGSASAATVGYGNSWQWMQPAWKQGQQMPPPLSMMEGQFAAMPYPGTWMPIPQPGANTAGLQLTREAAARKF